MRALLIAGCVALAACSDAPPPADAPPAAPPTDYEAIIAAIRRDFRRIEALGPAAAAGEFRLEGFSSEGGSARVFREGGRVVKIATHHQGEMGEAAEDYYYRGDSLIFVFRRESRYERIMGPVRSVEEDRFYIGEGRMVRWIGPGGKRRSVHDVEYPAEAANLLDFGARLLAAARADSAAITAP